MEPALPVTLLPQLPLFPLGSVLFPGGWLPLQIFELRYLDMIGRCHAAGEPFGVVCLSAGSEVRRPAAGGDGFAAEAFFPVGTLARITHLELPRPGLMLIRCVGAQRFRVQRSERRKLGLWVGDVELLADDAVLPVPDDLAFTRETLQGLARDIDPGATLPLCEPYRWDDCGWLANRWCELLPLDAPRRQRLMSLESPVLRLELVGDALVQMGLTAPRAR